MFLCEGLVLDRLGKYKLEQERYNNQGQKMVPEPRTLPEPKIENRTGTKNQEQYRNQVPRMVPNPRMVLGAPWCSFSFV